VTVIAAVVVALFAFCVGFILGGGQFTGTALGIGFGAAAASAVLAVGMGLLMITAMVYVEIGNVAAAAYAGEATMILGEVSKWVGYVGLVASLVNPMTYATMTLTQGLALAVSVLNVIAPVLKKAYLEDAEEQAAEDEEKVDASNELLEYELQKEADVADGATHAMSLQQRLFETYAFIELNTAMETIPYQMTQGLLDKQFTKYYT